MTTDTERIEYLASLQEGELLFHTTSGPWAIYLIRHAATYRAASLREVIDAAIKGETCPSDSHV